MANDYDVIIVGGGPAGEHAAARAVANNLTVVLVEDELVGGECSYWACMPSKTLLRPGQVLASARNVPGAAEAVTGALDVTEALARRDWMTANYDDKGQLDWVSSKGIGFVRGHARLVGERIVEIEHRDGTRQRLAAGRAVVLAVGSQAAVPPIAGLDEIRYWDNRRATAAKVAPRRLLVLGGGAVGVELAQAWRRLGSEEVTIVEGAGRLLVREEPFTGEVLAESLRAEGITILLGKTVIAASRADEAAPVTITLNDGASLVGDELLVAVGRRPRTTDLGLETVGLSPGRYIDVDDAMRASSIPEQNWLYAVGDVNGLALLTHMGKYQARRAIDAILGRDITENANQAVVPRIVFTDPQIASVGLTEADAKSKGCSVRIVTCEIGNLPAAEIAGRKIAGQCQIVVDTAEEVILGATFVGPEMGELLHAATIAIVGRVPMTRLRHAVPAFPSFSEVWLELVES